MRCEEHDEWWACGACVRKLKADKDRQVVSEERQGRPLTLAQRQALHRQRRAEREDKMRDAMRRAMAAKTIKEAREILAAALST